MLRKNKTFIKYTVTNSNTIKYIKMINKRYLHVASTSKFKTNLFQKYLKKKMAVMSRKHQLKIENYIS